MVSTLHENTRRTPVTVLGLGPMGRALASAFLDARHPVTVWNRTPGKAGDLPGRGAVVAGSVQGAVRAGHVVIVCLIDYDAVRATLEHAPADWEDRRLVNLTSGEPAQARRMSQWAAARGIDYLDGAVLTPTPAIGTPAGAVLLSGSRHVYEAVQETMAAVGGTATHVGDDPGRASAYEIALLDIFATSVNGIVHAFALASAEGIEPERFAAFAAGIGGFLPEMITRFAEQIRTGHYPGDRSTIASAASGITHIISTAAGHGIDVGMLTAAKTTIDQAVADGYGPQGLARLTTVLHAPARARP
ncbi:NAD(P)-dependent oxidoreductase [Streptomyces sasae]|uniref:NAD(P)-dependent oxidoreductase n=1 Tax=Streptomyces sasae TaxID=1266772 RepID=UPI002930222B|nr:NAD(P)-binding domain-containing protein [Streptomyces sasae]